MVKDYGPFTEVMELVGGYAVLDARRWTTRRSGGVAVRLMKIW